jgi:hypothetical protein
MSITYNPIQYPTSPGGVTYTLANTGTASSTWATITSNGSANLTPNSIQVKGDAEFEGDLKIQGKSLKESLDRIEERLAILRPNEELEEKWENLRGLRKLYMELEAEIIEKEKMWSILKK